MLGDPVLEEIVLFVQVLINIVDCRILRVQLLLQPVHHLFELSNLLLLLFQLLV